MPPETAELVMPPDPPELVTPPELVMPLDLVPAELGMPPKTAALVMPPEPPEFATPPELVTPLDPPRSVVPPLPMVPPLCETPPLATAPPDPDPPLDSELSAVVPPPELVGFSPPGAHPRPLQAASRKIPKADWRTERSFMKFLRWFT
jgi:hypothetical protein